MQNINKRNRMCDNSYAKVFIGKWACVCAFSRENVKAIKRCAFAALQPAVMWYEAVIGLVLLRLHVRETTLSARFQIGKWKAPRVHAHIKNCAHKLIAIEFQVHPISSMTLRMSAKMNCGYCSDDLIYFTWFFFSLTVVLSCCCKRGSWLSPRKPQNRCTYMDCWWTEYIRSSMCLCEWMSADARITFWWNGSFFVDIFWCEKSAHGALSFIFTTYQTSICKRIRWNEG